MKFFKHFVDAGEGKFMNALMDFMGVKAYSHYFLLVELCAKEYDPNDARKYNFEFTFHERIVCQKLRITRKNLRKFLEKCQEESARLLNESSTETAPEFNSSSTETEQELNSNSEPFQFWWNETQKEIKIKIPKLLECLDRDAKKARKVAAETRENAPKNKNKDKELDKEIRSEVEKIFDELYPIKKGLTEGLEVLSSEPQPLQLSELPLFRKAVTAYRNDCIKTKTKPEFMKHFQNFAKAWREWAKNGAGSSDAVFDPERDKEKAREKARLEDERTAKELLRDQQASQDRNPENLKKLLEDKKSVADLLPKKAAWQ